MKQEFNNALIIFARKPVLGKVKTRLAATIGNDKALEIYKKLLNHTRTVATNSNCEVFIFLTETDEEKFWEGFTCQLQNGENLGEKMEHAFNMLLNKGYKECIIVGSDCPGLNVEIIDSAFENLRLKEIIIGPAEDGGYYLLGIKKMYSSLFRKKNWSTKNVFSDTLLDIKKLGLSYHIMPILNDVDEEKDIPPEWL